MATKQYYTNHPAVCKTDNYGPEGWQVAKAKLEASELKGISARQMMILYHAIRGAEDLLVAALHDTRLHTYEESGAFNHTPAGDLIERLADFMAHSHQVVYDFTKRMDCPHSEDAEMRAFLMMEMEAHFCEDIGTMSKLAIDLFDDVARKRMRENRGVAA